MITTFEKEIQDKGFICYTNVGVSMMPLIRQGRDLMVIERIDRTLMVNDAVLFIRPGVEGRGKYVLHRIRRIDPDGTYFIIGDNCIDGETVSRENIIGILTQVKRGKRVVRNTDRSYIFYVKMWWIIFPLRKFLKKCRFFLGRIKRKILGRNSVK